MSDATDGSDNDGEDSLPDCAFCPQPGRYTLELLDEDLGIVDAVVCEVCADAVRQRYGVEVTS